MTINKGNLSDPACFSDRMFSLYFYLGSWSDRKNWSKRIPLTNESTYSLETVRAYPRIPVSFTCDEGIIFICNSNQFISSKAAQRETRFTRSIFSSLLGKGNNGRLLSLYLNRAPLPCYLVRDLLTLTNGHSPLRRTTFWWNRCNYLIRFHEWSLLRYCLF